jgi:polyhydroxybutyrate depolymerase
MKYKGRIALGLCASFVAAFVFMSVAKSRQASAKAALIREAMVETVSLTVDGIERRALVHVPVGYDKSKPVPLLFMLHGMGGSPEDCVIETGWVKKADAEGFIAVFPEATRLDMKRPAKFGSNNTAWNDGSRRFHSGEQNVNDAEFIRKLLDEMESRFLIDKDRVYVTGFSNGASMSFRVGIELSQRIAAIAPVSGALWFNKVQLEKGVSLLYITGNADSINPMDGGTPRMRGGTSFKKAPETPKPPVRQNIQTWVEALKCSPVPKTQNTDCKEILTIAYEGGIGKTDVFFTVIDGHGHVWPGAKAQLPEFIVGKATQHLQATDAIWEFFKKHPRHLPL